MTEETFIQHTNVRQRLLAAHARPTLLACIFFLPKQTMISILKPLTISRHSPNSYVPSKYIKEVFVCLFRDIWFLKTTEAFVQSSISPEICLMEDEGHNWMNTCQAWFLSTNWMDEVLSWVISTLFSCLVCWPCLPRQGYCVYTHYLRV
jgi:hypothetical protein